jgi:DNA-binding transcriptional LysR family regulator
MRGTVCGQTQVDDERTRPTLISALARAQHYFDCPIASLVQQFDTLFDDLRARRGGLVGTVKIRAPLGFGRRYLASVVSGFQHDNPDVDIELTLTDQPLTETAERYDIVVHIGEPPASNLIGYAIAPNARVVCASPAFLKRFPNPENPRRSGASAVYRAARENAKLT